MNELETAILDCNSRYYHLNNLQSMENAGRSVAEEVERRYGRGNDIGIFCGMGNNGGDGFVAARFLSTHNTVTVYLVGLPKHIQTDIARQNWDILTYSHVNRQVIPDSASLGEPEHDIIIDALLGTGISGELREPFRRVVEVLNLLPGKKVSVDIPTGYSSSTQFDADLTISMHYPKTDSCVTVTIGIPPEFETLVGPGDVKFLRRRKTDSHKGDNGRILIVGGSETYHGAPIYAGLAASLLVDLVFIACPASVATIIREATPDFIVHSLSSEFMVPEDVPRVLHSARNCDAILIGPGLGTEKETVEACKTLFSSLDLPMIIDADGLKALENSLELVHDTMVLTPHAHEFTLLFGDSPVEEVASSHGCIIVKKGVCDVISNGQKTRYNHTGNSGMTTGGTGDILAGLITGFAAVNDPFQASCAAAFVNGKAGDFCYEKYTTHYTSSDVIEALQKTLLWCDTF
ncbi:MAG: NAD(P)H-hydrate dehydratase [Theionarchaea archaeon]|nr:NAD(P)H-hydrate dehydratase [Theionarchaea archaeon]